MANIDRNMSAHFVRFAGKEVAVEETTRAARRRIYVSARLAEVNPAVDELKQAIEDMGLRLRLHLPGWYGTCDFVMDRVNVHVEKQADGKYRIAPKFYLG